MYVYGNLVSGLPTYVPTYLGSHIVSVASRTYECVYVCLSSIVR